MAEVTFAYNLSSVTISGVSVICTGGPVKIAKLHKSRDAYLFTSVMLTVVSWIIGD